MATNLHRSGCNLAEVAEVTGHKDLSSLSAYLDPQEGKAHQALAAIARRVRQNDQLASVPILIVTADRTMEEEQGLEIGVNGFIRKPVDFDELLEKVEKFC